MLSGKTRRDHSLWDEAINAKWNGQRPVLSPKESLAAAKKLWRHATGKSWKGKWALTSGCRFTRPMYGTFYVNPDMDRDRGIRGIVHSISHIAHRRLHPNDKPHSINQLRLEARLTKFAIEHGWANPKAASEPMPQPPKPGLQERRALRARSALARAEHRLRLAQAAVARLKPRVIYYEKALAKPKAERKPRAPRVSTKQRALTLAAQIGAEIDLYPDSARPSICWPPEWLPEERDEWAGDHCVSTWADCLPMLQAWAELERVPT